MKTILKIGWYQWFKKLRENYWKSDNSFDKSNKKLYNEYTKGSNIAKYYEKEIPSL